MIPNNCTSACRYCRFYHPEGRRGGMCDQLNVTVQGNWKSCSLSVPAFGHSWQPMRELALLEKSFSLGCATPKIEEVATISHQIDLMKTYELSKTSS